MSVGVINIRGLRYAYPGGDEIFGGLDFALHEAQRLALLGANGSGKSTLMHIIMGLVKPDVGEMELFGRRCSSEEDFVVARREVGFLFQDSDDQLFCPTVAEDIAFGPLNLGHTHAEARQIVEDTCALLGIAGLRTKVTHRLSGGEKRLVALATAVAMKPRVMILDEPTAGLDKEHVAKVLDFINNHVDTCIISSHDADFLGKCTNGVFELK